MGLSGERPQCKELCGANEAKSSVGVAPKALSQIARKLYFEGLSTWVGFLIFHKLNRSYSPDYPANFSAISDFPPHSFVRKVATIGSNTYIEYSSKKVVFKTFRYFNKI